MGLTLAGFIKRHTPNDALVSRGGERLSGLSPGARVGTSSIRRRSLIAHLRPDVEILDLRGNVDTRLKKLDEGRYDAIVLATAGLERLGLAERITERLDLSLFPPAVSQGAMALEVREGDADLIEMLGKLTDEETEVAVTAERELLRTLEGGCQVPLGALGTVEGKKLVLRASIVAPDGSLRVDGSMETDDFSTVGEMGKSLANQLIQDGGDKILAMVRGDEM